MANWKKIQHRGNVTDRRMSGGAVLGGGITTVILLMGVTYLMGGNPLEVLLETDPEVFMQTQSSEDSSQFEGVDEYELFVSTVLGSTDEFWETEFRKIDREYTEPELVLFRGRTTSSCGGASSVSGPHYCPADSTIYLDETFFTQLQTKLGATGGDVAEAYVIAHEVGHHVQNELNLLGNRTSNAASVQTELQADCLAGAWMGSLKDQGIFEKNEIFEAIDAAEAVGDDNIQQRVEGEIQPESWTHGSSQERRAYFETGYQTTNLAGCIRENVY